MQKLKESINSQLLAIEMCIEKRFLSSALTLIYSGIDNLAYLNMKENQHVKPRYLEWIIEYMDVSSKLHCKPIDLYGARCGIVHTNTSHSDLSEKKEAVQIIYSYGTTSKEKLQWCANRLPTKDKIMAIQIEELFEEYKNGIDNFFIELEKNPKKSEQVKIRAQRRFITMKDE